MNVARLSSDWHERYGHDIVLAETFVDAERAGTCYRAAGWVALGVTKGFRRIGTDYQRHGIIHTYLLKPLMENVPAFLCGPALPVDRPLRWIDATDLPVDGEHGLFALLQRRIADPRNPSGRRYPLSCLLGLLVAGLIAGNQTVEDIATWARQLPESVLQRFRCRYSRKYRAYRAPCANASRYVLQDIDPAEVERIAVEWLGACGINTTNTVIAIDGKTVCGAVNAQGEAPKLVSMYVPDAGVVIDQAACRRDHDEAPTARDLIDRHDLTGSLVTADAGHTNPESAQQIRKEGATTCLPSKGTSPAFWLQWSRRSTPQTLPAFSSMNNSTGSTVEMNSVL